MSGTDVVPTFNSVRTYDRHPSFSVADAPALIQSIDAAAPESEPVREKRDYTRQSNGHRGINQHSHGLVPPTRSENGRVTDVQSDLGGHFESGHLWTVRNRPFAAWRPETD